MPILLSGRNSVLSSVEKASRFTKTLPSSRCPKSRLLQGPPLYFFSAILLLMRINPSRY